MWNKVIFFSERQSHTSEKSVKNKIEIYMYIYIHQQSHKIMLFNDNEYQRN